MWSRPSRSVPQFRSFTSGGVVGQYKSGNVGKGSDIRSVLAAKLQNGVVWKGTQRLPDGSVYNGEFWKGQRHGKGKLTYEDGGFHEGEFREGKLWAGTGILKISSDEVYQGETKEGKFNGQGMLSTTEHVLKGEFRDGSIWNGVDVPKDGGETRHWKDGKIDGLVSLITPVNPVKLAYDSINGGERARAEQRNRLFMFELPVRNDGGERTFVPWTNSQGQEMQVLNFENGDSYRGRVVNGMMNGQGVLTYSNGESFKGEFRNDQPWTGSGTKFLGSGTSALKLTGKFKHGRVWHGVGFLKVKAGGFYEGEFKEGIMHGQGTFTYPDGRVWKGEFKNGKMWTGCGACVFSNGSEYEGEYSEGRRNGQGKFVYPDGRIIEGEFKEGKMWNVTGVVVRKDGSVYEGEFKEGMMHGWGKLTSGGGPILKEDIRNIKIWSGAGVGGHGQGEIVFPNSLLVQPEQSEFEEERLLHDTRTDSSNPGEVYEGEFYQGKPHGQGKLTYPDGRSHEGEFFQGVIWNGTGYAKTKNGFREGTFREGKLWQGTGKLTHNGGKVYEGAFDFGKMHGQGTLTFVGGQQLHGEFRYNTPWNVTGTLRFYSSVDYFEGTLKDNLFHGEGKFTYADGRCLEGVYREGKLMYGIGVLKTLNKEDEGEFYAGKLHGQGKTTYPDGTMFVGEYRDGEMWNGRGVRKTIENVYREEFVSREVNDIDIEEHEQSELLQHISGMTEKEASITEGKHNLRDGCVFEPEIINNKVTEQGTLTYPDGRVLAGKFRTSKLWNGVRVLEYVGGNVFVGVIKEGKMHGQGKLTYPDGRACEGEFWKNELWNGTGVMFLDSHRLFYKDLGDEEIHQHGAFLCTEGHELCGEIRKGKLWNGTCVVKFIYGNVYTREFKEGKICGEGRHSEPIGSVH